METIGSTFNNFDFIVNSFRLCGIDFKAGMVDKSIGIMRKPFGKLVKLPISRSHSFTHPGLKEGGRFTLCFAIKIFLVLKQKVSRSLYNLLSRV